MKYEYVIRTYSKDGRNIYAEGAYAIEQGFKKFDDVCKVANDVTDIFRKNGNHNYCKVAMIRLSDGEIISEKIYEC